MKRETSGTREGLRPARLAWAVVFLICLSVVIAVQTYTLAQDENPKAAKDEAFKTFPVGNAPIAIAFDGVAVWVANYLSDSVTEIRAKRRVEDGHVRGRDATLRSCALRGGIFGWRTGAAVT